MRTICFILLLTVTISVTAQNKDVRYFEMRTYHCNPGKRPDLIKRFENHTIRLFKKHGIENIAYFIPADTSNYSLTFILAYPDKPSRDVFWNRFANDPEWIEAAKKSEENGKLVAKVDQVFMTLAPELSPTISQTSTKERHVFELRVYHCFPGKVEDINARFRDHTRKLFEKHGMIKIAYWFTQEPDDAQPKLVYLLAHDSEKSGKTSFESFRSDPAWIKVKEASEAKGKIVEKVESTYLEPLPFSPLK